MGAELMIDVVTDYGDENPLLMDYFGFPPELYELKFKSKGDSALTRRVIELYKEVRSVLALLHVQRA
jgi:aromatic ring-opening dioxygenase catalytic subunit (LigB family)